MIPASDKIYRKNQDVPFLLLVQLNPAQKQKAF